MDTITTLGNYTPQQVREAFTNYVSNQKKCDKFAVQYFIGMIAGHTSPFALFGGYKRAELLNKLLELINTDANLYACIKSDYTREQILANIK
jgi:hypothetical protein